MQCLQDLTWGEKANDIHIFDTMSLSLGSGQFVIKACDLIEEGLNVDEIIKELDSIRESVMLFFAPKTLDYLKKERESICSYSYNRKYS